ncbi:MAG: class I SAM-dependent rRNA methyltransferase [Abditibacteriales bacterium]|nr:class I SAM-dependent rRNA methyltransferase [Abditibacteriales bacterium]MDW8367217.1 class I SAM-dependent rRNA methyltransferase [Abditibacteriales bacterium]
MQLPSVILKRGRERSVINRHPWVFSGAVSHVSGDVQPGDIVDVRAHDGAWLGRGAVNPHSDVFVRLMTWDESQAVDEAFVQERLAATIARRGGQQTCRLVYLEADGLPGLIVDRYGDVVIVQILTPAMERWRDVVVNALVECVQPRSLYERSDTDVRQREGLSLRTGVLWGAEPPELIQVVAEGTAFLVDVRRGQKTGFFLDQRINHWQVAAYCAGKTVLNCFSYTGGFAIAALKRGAQKVINVDTSADALALAARTAELNGVADRMENVQADVFQFLRQCRDDGAQFDVIILDPPKFAHSKAALDRACRGYKDINWLAMRLLKPAGILVTFSCSGLVTPALFQSVVAGAAVDAQRTGRIIAKLSQPPDHPILLTFPESEYLKGLVCAVE